MCLGPTKNEDNVDIFRNFVYGDTPAPPNPHYDALNAFLNPTEWTGSVKEQADSDINTYIEQQGFNAMNWFVSGLILQWTSSWILAFQIAAAINVFGLVFYLIFASTEKEFD